MAAGARSSTAEVVAASIGSAGSGTAWNHLAVVSLVLSLSWFGGLASATGVRLGVVALRQTRAHGERGVAVALIAIVVGVAGVTLAVRLVAAMLV